MRRRTLTVVTAVAVVLTGCSGGDDGAPEAVETTSSTLLAVTTTEVESTVPVESDPTVAETTTTVAETTTTTATTTTVAPTTTAIKDNPEACASPSGEWLLPGEHPDSGEDGTCEDGEFVPTVPADVQQAYLDAGQPRLTPDEYEEFTEACDNLATDPTFQMAYWAEDRTDEDRQQILTNVAPLCPEVEQILNEVKPLPTISSGTYIAGSEIEPGLYRVSGYWALLDQNQDIIDNELTDRDQPGYALMNVPESGVSFVEISGDAIKVADLPSFDPLAEGVTQGVYLVGSDISPGTYRVSDAESAYAARLALVNGQLDIVDNALNEGNVILTIQDGDFAFSFSGTLERIE